MRIFREQSGQGSEVVLLHGLTATHRYVVMGSKALERSGHAVLAYDARGHGRSDPAPSPDAYRYEDLATDLAGEIDRARFGRVTVAGSSMGAHTAVRYALDNPDRVAALVLITPAFLPGEHDDVDLQRWDALSAGLRHDGVEGFLDAYGEPAVKPEMRDTILKVVRQRLALHEHPGAVADALTAVPRSTPFGSLADLEAITVPAVVVADRDDVDPGHPLAVGQAWAAALPKGRLVVEEPGASPIAWQGSQISSVIAAAALEGAR